MDKVEALRELLYEDSRPRVTKASIGRVKRIAKALDMSVEDIAFKVLDFSEDYVSKLMEKKGEEKCSTLSE